MKEINILPKLRQKELAYEALFFGLVRLVEVAALTFVFVLLGQLIVWSYMRATEVSLQNKITKIAQITNKEDNAKLKAQIREINGQITDYKSLLDYNPTWSKVVKQLTADLPSGVKIINVTGDSKLKKIEVRGYSPTRELVIDFYNQVQNDKSNFKSINYPLENVSKPTDVTFSFIIQLEDSLLFR
jgi:Tfp pilus assembly protein PilN